MKRFIHMIGFWAILMLSALPAGAQGGPDAHTLYPLNVRSGPGAAYPVLTRLPADVGLILEGRNEDAAWLLGHTEDGAFRGWVASLYLRYSEGFSAVRLPYSSEEMAYTPPTASPETVAAAPAVTGIAPALESVPIVPAATSHAHEIFLRGQALGNDPRGLTKIGECNSMSYAFLAPFGMEQYELGAYGSLQSTIDFFPASSWTRTSVATRAGLTSSMVIDPAWSDPGVCGGGLSMLECEYKLARPSVAFIMLGMQDVYFLSAQEYEQSMRRVIEISIDHGVIPVLTTFPALPGDYGPRDQARLDFNTIVVNLGHEYDVPVMNLWLATQRVANHGVGVDFVHVSQRGDIWTSFAGDEEQYGFTMWNLVALQTLSQLQSVMGS